MSLYERLLNRETKLAVVGLGYVGLPLAVAFGETADVIGFDINDGKIRHYRDGEDPTGELGPEAIRRAKVEFTSDEKRLKEARFIIVAVPTPVNPDHTPDLKPVESSSEIVGRNLQKGSIVVYESTVYPGVTEEICIPILEKASGLRCGTDFSVGYSPERINPGDKVHRLENIRKIVSGLDEETLETVAQVYRLVVKAGVYPAESIKVAEAAKVIENSQRDINIAFVNELSLIFNKMGIDTKSVLEAAGTKWNFLPFSPGLVGGHCIGIDPYYLTYKADQLGYHSQVILAGRAINDGMGAYVAQQTVKQLAASGTATGGAKVGILGITFKENCPDCRNSKVADIVQELREYGVETLVADPHADREEAERFYGIQLADLREFDGLSAVIVAVGHREFAALSEEDFKKMIAPSPDGNRVLVDVKGILNKKEYEAAGFRYWRL